MNYLYLIKNTVKPIMLNFLFFIMGYTTFKSFIVYLKWVKKGKPMVKYHGFNCGCCGAWENHEFEVPEYRADDWWDT